MKDQVFAIVRQEGALLPVKIASKLGIDSFLANAYLTELMEAGQIFRTKERIGTSFIYYVKGAEDKIKQFFQMKPAKTARTYGVPSKTVSPELAAKQAEFAARAQKIEAGERRTMQRRAPQQRPILRQMPPRPVARQIPQQPRPTRIITPPVEEIQHTFLDEAMDWLRMNDIEILDEISRKKRVLELIVQTPSNFGKLKLFASIRDKKSITESDISIAQSRALSRGLQAAIITNGKLSKSGKEFRESEGNKIMIKQL